MHAYTTARLLISTATVFTHSQTSGRRPWRAVSPALEERERESDGKRQMKERPFITLHTSTLVSFIELMVNL